MFERDIRELSRKGLLRQLLARTSAQGAVVAVGGKRYINFSSNDYLGLAADPALAKAAAAAMKKYGFGSGASRLLAGGTLLHEETEALLADWKGTEAALVFNSGYSANIGIIPALAAEKDIIFSDELNHASIVDGCRLSRARTAVYRHKDVDHLKTLLKKEKGRRKIIVTDTVFSMDGDIAPVDSLYDLIGSLNSSRLTPHSSLLYLDDAHATGVLGKGRGSLAHFNLTPEPWVLQMGTFSKALGSFGSFAAGSMEIIQWLTSTCRSLLFSTALPSPVIAASGAAVRMVMKRPALARRLWLNRELLARLLKEAGFEVAGSETPIIPVKTGTTAEALAMSGFLFEHGVYVPAIRPPTVREPRLRIVVTAAHEAAHIERLVYLLEKWKRRRA